MTKEELAERLTGREYGDEITKAQELLAKESGLLAIFGYSDDNIEFRGVFSDEAGCYNGGEVLFDAKGILPDWDNVRDNESDAEEYFARKASARKVEAVWGECEDDYSWTYKTDIPHATFEIVEGEEKYCRGIVIDVRELGAK